MLYVASVSHPAWYSCLLLGILHPLATYPLKLEYKLHKVNKATSLSSLLDVEPHMKWVHEQTTNYIDQKWGMSVDCGTLQKTQCSSCSV